MTRDQYEALLEAERDDLICATDLEQPSKDRTLLYGYTCSRDTFHVYLKDSMIHVVVYKTAKLEGKDEVVSMREIKPKYNTDYIPDKRLCPNRCDFNFCKMLVARAFSLPFTSWTDEVEEKVFYGLTLEDVR